MKRQKGDLGKNTWFIIHLMRRENVSGKEKQERKHCSGLGHDSQGERGHESQGEKTTINTTSQCHMWEDLAHILRQKCTESRQIVQHLLFIQCTNFEAVVQHLLQTIVQHLLQYTNV